MGDYVLDEIKRTAANYGAQKVVLYGSRARGDHSSSSDYDIAVIDDKITLQEKAKLYADIDEIPTLKKIDLVFLKSNCQDDFAMTVIGEGIVIYEQATG